MKRRATAAERVVLLLALVPYLTERGDVTIGELAEQFDVDVALMRELVEFLGTAGVPGETRTYQDEDLFDIDWAALEDAGVVRLLRRVAIDDVPRFSSLERASLIAALQALAPALPSSLDGAVAETLRKLQLASGDTGSEGSHPRIRVSSAAEGLRADVSIMSEAIARGAVLEFDYSDTQGARTHRRVLPRKLSQSGSGWYLHGYCLSRRADRTFALDGMGPVKIGAATPPSEGRPGIDRHAPVREQISAESEGVTATVRVRNTSLHRIGDFSPKEIGPAGAGWTRVTVVLTHASVAVRLVQCAVGEVIVERPDAAQAAVCEWADRALAKYDL